MDEIKNLVICRLLAVGVVVGLELTSVMWA
jgi:hypothetical protein